MQGNEWRNGEMVAKTIHLYLPPEEGQGFERGGQRACRFGRSSAHPVDRNRQGLGQIKAD
jgi:hypothetical protein